MKYLLLTAFAFCLLAPLNAQNLWLGKEGQKFYDELVIRKALKGEKPDYDGSPYMKDEFSESIVIFKSGEVFEEVPLRYNIFNDQFEAEMEKGVYALKRGSVVTEVIIDDRHFEYSPYIYMSKEKAGYLELLHKGDYSLYRQLQVEFKEAQPAQPYIEERPAMFNRKNPLYYIAKGDETPVFIKNRRDAISYGKQNGMELKKYIKKNKLRMRDLDDFMQVVKYMNQQ